MDLVYLCRPGPNEELRFSLRSLVNLPHERVFIAGGSPAWVREATFMELPPMASKYETTTTNLRRVLADPRVSDPFILMNDDFYVMRKGGAPPAANRGRVREVIAEYEQRGVGDSRYVRGMRDTLVRLERHGYADPLSFELHVPLVVHKEPMREALDLGVGIPVVHKRTAYGAVAGLRGRRYEDVKVAAVDEPLPTGRWLSTQDDTFAAVRPHLAARFPTPSRYES